eukprot:590197_1
MPKFEKVTFVNILLNDCVLPKLGAIRQPSKEDAALCDSYKKEFLGNLVLIGELFNLNAFQPKIVWECMAILCKVNSPDEYHLECMVTLSKTVGQKLVKLDKARWSDHFQKVRKLAVSDKVSFRIRTLLLDLEDFRKRRWMTEAEWEATQIQPRRTVMRRTQSMVIGKDAVSYSRNRPHTPRFRRPNSAVGGSAPVTPTPVSVSSGGEDGWATVGSVGRKAGRRSNKRGGTWGYDKSRSVSTGEPVRATWSRVAGPQDVRVTVPAEGGMGRTDLTRSISSPIASPRGSPRGKFTPPTTPGGSARFGTPKHSTSRFGSVSTPKKKKNSASRTVSAAFGALEESDGDNSDSGYSSGQSSQVGGDGEGSATSRMDGDNSDSGYSSGQSSQVGGDGEGSATSRMDGDDDKATIVSPKNVIADRAKLVQSLKTTILEYFKTASTADLRTAIGALSTAGSEVFFVKTFVTIAFEKKDRERSLLVDALKYLFTENVIRNSQIVEGVLDFLDDFEDFVIDNPLSPAFLGKLLADLIVFSAISMRDSARIVKNIVEFERNKVSVNLLQGLQDDGMSEEKLASYSKCQEIADVFRLRS